jgi:hypothetical protein
MGHQSSQTQLFFLAYIYFLVELCHVCLVKVNSNSSVCASLMNDNARLFPLDIENETVQNETRAAYNGSISSTHLCQRRNII